MSKIVPTDRVRHRSIPPHVSLTLPFNCFQLPSIRFQLMSILLWIPVNNQDNRYPASAMSLMASSRQSHQCVAVIDKPCAAACNAAGVVSENTSRILVYSASLRDFL